MSKEYIEKVFEKFDDHLSIENNKRVIFSGKFGIGKSYFLKEFFEDKKYNDNYIPIFLNPVNYSISSNEDIFELIKFDILYHILDKQLIDFENFSFSTENLLYQYFSNKFLNEFFSTIDLIGETAINQVVPKSYNLLKSLGKLAAKISEVGKRDYEKFKKEIENNSDLEEIGDFFEKELLRKGSHYENNSMTQIIRELVENIKRDSDKEIVLVIDDLDRIDPEHIFRILNILSAQNIEYENKFGFEKIILVCDLKNIKSIYHHFYGNEVDFFGYINKFYSLEVYDYKNTDYLLAFGKDFKIDDSNYYMTPILEFLKFILSEAIANNYITARQLFNNDFSSDNIYRVYNNYTKIVSGRIYYNGTQINDFSQFYIPYSLIQTLLYFFGDEKSLLKFINNLDKYRLIFSKEILVNLLMFSELKKISKSTIFSVQNISLKSNERGDCEFVNSSQIETMNLRSVFADILKIIENIVVK